jgi:ATP-dependent DNA helicase PIF1
MPAICNTYCSSPATPPATLDDWAADPSASAVRAVRNAVNAGQSILAVGAAGTGKSTLLRLLAAEIPNTPVLAPTGIAARQAGGQTIHAFFRLEPGVQRRGCDGNERPEDLYRAITALIVDEVSMVRADTLDKIDWILRRARGSQAPFGGVQMLMFGDLLQLPPVVGKTEVEAFSKLAYHSPYLFEAVSFSRMSPASLVLDRVHRQADIDFVSVLHAVRRGYAAPHVLARLNKRVLRAPSLTGHTSLALTARRFDAEIINSQRLNALGGTLVTYRGRREGRYPTADLPVPHELHLAVGARVMLVRNDPDKRWVNGTLARVVACKPGWVDVVCADSGNVMTVEPVTWENHAYAVDETTGEIGRRTVGRYTQVPVTLAWAATVHKSQGLTLDRVHVDLGRTGAFAPGQTYVALSRCRSEQGLTLERALRATDLSVDAGVIKFLRRAGARAA